MAEYHHHPQQQPTEEPLEPTRTRTPTQTEEHHQPQLQQMVQQPPTITDQPLLVPRQLPQLMGQLQQLQLENIN